MKIADGRGEVQWYWQCLTLELTGVNARSG